MVSLLPSSVSTEHFLAYAVSVGVLVISAYAVLSLRRRKFPPKTKEGLIHNVQALMDGKNSPLYYLSKMKELGLVFQLRMPEFERWMVICDPALARTILLEEEEKPFLLQRFMGLTNGINTVFSKRTHGEQWHSARKGVAPSFSMTNICLTVPKMYQKIKELTNILRVHEANQTTFDVPEMMTQLTMDLICAAMFDTDLNSMQSDDSKGRFIIKEFELGLREFALKQIINPFRKFMIWDKELQRANLAALNIEKSQQDLLDKYRSTKTSAEIEKDPSILAHLVRSTYASDKERCADMTILMLAGHDTTSYSMSWILIEVAKNPEVYLKVKKEVDQATQGDEDITPKQLNEMVYLDWVIKEGMRLWPVAALGPLRMCSKDIKYQDMTIPKGCILQLPFYVIFRTGIEDPELFIPDRWAPDAPEAEKLKEMYFPFSAGKRNCVGQNLASLEMKLVLASLLRSFRFELKSEVDMDYFLTLKPTNAHMMVYSAK